MITYMQSQTHSVSHEEFWEPIKADWPDYLKKADAEYQVASNLKRANLLLAISIKERREKLRLSQRKLAEISGVSQREICHIEKAKSNPTISTQFKLLMALGLQFNIVESN